MEMEPNVWRRLPLKVEATRRVEARTSPLPSMRHLVKRNALKRSALHAEPTTNRDVLEVAGSFQVSYPDLSTVPPTYCYLTQHGFLPPSLGQKIFWKKFNDLTQEYRRLVKSHNARCGRGSGSHKHGELATLLDRPFYRGSVRQTETRTDLPLATGSPPDHNAVYDQVTVSSSASQSAPSEVNMVTAPLTGTPPSSSMVTTKSKDSSTTPLLQKQHLRSTPPMLCDLAVQVASPQLLSEDQLRRRHRVLKRTLSSTEKELTQSQKKLKQQYEKNQVLDEKRKNAMKLFRKKRDSLTQLNNAYKQTKSVVKSTKQVHAELKKTKKENEKCQGTLEKIIDENIDLDVTVRSLENQVGEQKQKLRKVQLSAAKAKQRKRDFEESIRNLCDKVVSGDCVNSLDQLLESVVTSQGGNKTLIKTLAEAIKSPVPLKEKNAYKDHVALLAMELQNVGVPQASVGKVVSACTRHLCGRETKQTISRRTAGRMVRRGGILSDIQVAVETTASCDKGIRVSQDTTTRRGTEHVSTLWGIRDKENNVKYLQSRVQFLPNHTSDVQSAHIIKELERCNTVLDAMELPSAQKLSIAHVVEFMGDHINSKLHRNLEEEHLKELNNLIDSGAIPAEKRGLFENLYKSACQQHSGAKVSRAFFDGMQKKEPEGLCSSLGRYGLNQKKGRTFDAAGGKTIEFASMQLSPDYAGTTKVDFNWADVYEGWCRSNNKVFQRIGFVNKNRHYRHEHEATKLIESGASIIDFYKSRALTRDPKSDQTLRNKDQLVLEGLQNLEIKAQLAAADAMRYAFYGPYLRMVKSTDVLSVGAFIRQAHEFLAAAAENREVATQLIEGKLLLFQQEFAVEDSKKPVGQLHYSEEIMERAVTYLQAGCESGAAGLKDISKEYFDGVAGKPPGQYFAPTENMVTVLTGQEPHSDRNEGNFGQFSQQLRREPNARLQTISSKVAMRANNTLAVVRSDDSLKASVAKTRRLERVESQNTKAKQLAELAVANEPHLDELRSTVARRQTKRLCKDAAIQEQVLKDGDLMSATGVQQLTTKYPTAGKRKEVLKKHINYKKIQHPNVAAENKKLFLFSQQKKVLNAQRLAENLTDIIKLVETVVQQGESDSESDESQD